MAEEAGAAVELAQVSASIGAPIGRVDTVDGRVSVTRIDGSRADVDPGAPIFQGDIVTTGKDAKIGIEFVDSSSFSLGGEGRVSIDEMVFDPGAQTGKGMLKVAEGVFSFVSGQIAKAGADAMVLATPVATIGIRGTAVAGKAAASGSTNTITLLNDPGGGTGEITVRTQSGVVTMNQAFQTTQVSSAFLPPAQPVTMPASVVQKVFGAVTQSLPAVSGVGQGGPVGPAARAAAMFSEGPGPTGPAGRGPQQGPDQGKVSKAADDAFNNIVAQGGSLEQAFSAATQAAVTTAVESTLTRIAAAREAGDGQTALPGFGLVDMSVAGKQSVASLAFVSTLNQIANALYGDPFGPVVNFLVLPPEIRKEVKIELVKSQIYIQNAVTTFDETIAATIGNDTIAGGGLNTLITMAHDNKPGGLGTLGGTDTINGGGGTDQLTLSGLVNFLGVWNLATDVIQYYSSKYGYGGQITISSVEQIYIEGGSDGGPKQLMGTAGVGHAASGYAYIVVGHGTGGSQDDTISLASGTLTYGTLTTPDLAATTTVGSVMFGLSGDDVLTGSNGSDIIRGNAGDDTLNGLEGADSLGGYDGNDTLVVQEASHLNWVKQFSGGSGTDSIQIGNGSTATASTSGTRLTYDFSSALTGGGDVEALRFYNDYDMAKFACTVFESFTTIGKASGQSPISNILLGVGYSTLNLSNVTLSNNIIKIKIVGASSEGGVTIRDTQLDSGSPVNSRMIEGNQGTDTLYGYYGNDRLAGLTGGDTLYGGDGADTFLYVSAADGAAAGATTGYDRVMDFVSGTDKITIGNGGSQGINSGTYTKNLLTTMDDVTANGTAAISSVASGGANLSTAEVVFFTGAVNAGDLTQSGLAAVIGKIGIVTAGTATAADAQNDALFVLNDGTNTGVYLYTNSNGAGAGNTTVEASELQLVAHVENSIVAAADVTFDNTL